MQTLPHDLLARLPLCQRSLARLARTCASLRDGVAAVWCGRGIHLHARHLACLRDDRYAPLRSLRVHGAFAGPLPRPFPALRRLRLERCRPVDDAFWARLARDTPELRSLSVRVQFEGGSYAATLRSLRALLDTLPALWPRLEELQLHGEGIVLWRSRGRSCPGRRRPCSPLHDALAAVDEVAAMPPARLPPALARLEITGRQFCPPVDAPLLHARLDEPYDAGAEGLAARLGPLARARLTSLVWSVPAAVAPLPSLERLRDLDVRVVEIRTADALDAAIDALGTLPPTLERLRAELDFEHLADGPLLPRFDRAPLAGLPRLRALDLTLSFPTRNWGQLLDGLLGAPAACLEAASLTAEHGPAFTARQWRDYLLRDEGADPDDDSIRELDWEIEEEERACAVPRERRDAALAAFPRLRALSLRGGFPHLLRDPV